jgi:glucose/arabinose dehydrogenase
MLAMLTTTSRQGSPLSKRVRTFKPLIESLEDRVVPAVVDAVNFTESTYINNAANLSLATGLAWAPDGSNRLFVARKGGQVRIVQDGALLTTPFATVSPIFTNSECGLIGITFDRDYVNNRFVYLFVTVSNSQQQIIRYTDTSNIGMNKTTIVSNLPTQGANHDGGGVGIGIDNKLYWSIGDQGNGTGVDANLTTLAAKVGRANLDGTPVVDNPFNDQDGVVEPVDYIWARGFRNPFTLTFQESTGQLWVNDVGTAYEQVFKVNAGDHAGWDNLEGNQTAGFIQPEIIYRTNGTDSRNIAASGAVRNNNIVTFTTTGTLPQAFLQPGNKITISGVGDASFNGTFDILAVPSTTTFTVAQNGANATSGGGTAVTASIGGAITGGAFYTSTAFPAAFQGNYFFGDFNSGRVMRVTLDAANNVTSVNSFSTGITNIVDIAVGPDGALYYIGAGGDGLIRRTAFNATGQNLIVGPTAMNLVEGGRQGFSVRLATAPASDVTVTITRATGDSDFTVASGATLTFTPANFNMPQAVILDAAHDPDTANDTATFSVSAGLIAQTQTINVLAIDDDILIDETPTTTSLTAMPSATTGGSLVTLTATIAPSPGNLGTVAFLDNGVPLSGAGSVAVSGGTAVFTTSSLAVGSHPISAVYSGAGGFASSTSSTQTVTITGAAGPQVVSVTPNGNISALQGAQRSRVASLVVTFDQVVQLDTGAMTVGLHLNNVSYNGVPQPAGYGVPPASLNLTSSDNKTWIVTFIGNTDNGVDGFNSIRDGVYDLRIDAAKVHPAGSPGVNMAADSVTTFHRLFGETDAPTTPSGGTPGLDFEALVNTGDNLIFRGAFNNAANYLAYLDFDGDGTIISGDNLQFRTRFNKSLIWRA